MFKLEIGDIFVYVNEGKGLKSSFSRWAIGRYEHVSMFVGEAFGNVPFICESTGRGVAFHSLQSQTGRLVVVMRPEISSSKMQWVISNAIELATDPQAYYDYFTIVKSCIPRVLKAKLPYPFNLLIPVKYHRDPMMICSEAVAEVYWRAEIPILPEDVVPLPGDFETSSVLERVAEGRLFEDIQP